MFRMAVFERQNDFNGQRNDTKFQSHSNSHPSLIRQPVGFMFHLDTWPLVGLFENHPWFQIPPLVLHPYSHVKHSYNHVCFIQYYPVIHPYSFVLHPYSSVLYPYSLVLDTFTCVLSISLPVLYPYSHVLHL